MTDEVPNTSEEQRPLAAGWVSFADTMPLAGECYWILDTNRYRMLAHLDNQGIWRSFDIHGRPFKLVETYTHWTQCREPAIYG